MSTIKNDQILLYCHFNKIIKEPGTSFQSPAFSQKDVRNVCHTAHQYLTKFHKHQCNLHYAAILMMMSQILKSAGFTKTQKSRYLENEILFFRRTFVTITSLYGINILSTDDIGLQISIFIYLNAQNITFSIKSFFSNC